ncbi:Dabb family protein [Streptomyces sp. 150FB]|uniref:Dabb family protein n=1 Tax=Streptomyces sp. 150FB TaxID=1576605 RepID=UPI00099D29BB|nr:Dabb family protein [Streptomyces sp. 150FB]
MFGRLARVVRARPRFSFREGTTEEEKADVLAAMRRTATVDSASFGTVGQDLGDPSEGFTHAYAAGVEDLAALERYMHDPVHLEGDFTIVPRLAKLSAVRFSDDLDPGLSGKIMAMHSAKVAKYPEWGQLLDSIPQARITTGP